MPRLTRPAARRERATREGRAENLSQSLTNRPEETAADPVDVPDVDPDIAGHVIAVRDRFGVSGLRQAARLITVEISLAEDALRELGRD